MLDLAREGKKMGEGEKWGVAMGGAHFKPDVRRWGTGRWGGTTRQVRAKGGGVSPRPAGGSLAGSGPRLTGVGGRHGHAAWPVQNRGVRGLTCWPRP
jgi:hypothetical protein